MVVDFALNNGFNVLNLEYSPIKGPEGNIEYLLYIEKNNDIKADKNDFKEKINDIVELAHGELDK